MSQIIVSEYDRRAVNYEKKWKRYLEHTHLAFLNRLEIKPGDRILDVSGGTGLLAKKLVELDFPFEKIVVNDPSEKMLEIAKKRLAEDRRVTFTSNYVEMLPYKPGSFDLILCLNAFHFYRNQQKVIARFHRLLNSGGRLYLLDWDRSGFFRFINSLINWFAPEPIDTRSLNELCSMLEQSDFKVESRESWRWTYWKFLFIEATPSQSPS